MSRITLVIATVFAFTALLALTTADEDTKHKKVVIHVPFKVHTVHHHHVKKIPIYHYHEDHDHHHHHHHHHEKKDHHHHHHIEEEDDHHGHGWD